MKSWKKTDGVVSIFLIIILVPCLFISALFVDLGRVYLSREMAYSSADLALNTVMTQYDSVLNDYFGLVASCQDMDEFYKESAEFYLRTIQSQELTDDEINTLVNQYAALTNDDTIYDLLGVEAIGDVTIEPVEDADLSNATMLKEQVVEFMKYRAPIEIVANIVERLKSDGTGLTKAQEADKNEPIVDAKEEFYKAESDLRSAAYESYKYLYQNYTKANLDNSYLTERITKLQNIRLLYQDIHKLMISNLYNTGGLQKYSRQTIALDKYNGQYYYYTDGIYSRMEVDDDNKPHYYIDGADLSKAFTDLETAIKDFKDKKDALLKQMQSVSYTEGVTNEIQYWYQVDKAIKTYDTALGTAADTMIKEYAKLKARNSCELGTGLPEGWSTTYTNLMDEVEELQKTYLVAGKTSTTDQYLILVSRLEKISKDNQNNIKSSVVKVDSDYCLTTKKTIDAELTEAASELAQIKKDCQKYVDILNVVINGRAADAEKGIKEIKSLDAIKALAATYSKELTEFETTVNNAEDTSMKEQAQEEVVEIKDNEENYSDINAESVTEMKNRLTYIKKQFESVISAVDGMTYGGEYLTNIKYYTKLRSEASEKVGANSIGLTNTEIETYANNTFNQLFVPTISSNADIVKINTTDDYNLILDPVENKVKVPELYLYFNKNYKITDDEAAKLEETENEKSTAEGEVDNLKSGNETGVINKLLNEDAAAIKQSVSKAITSKKEYSTLTNLDSIISLVSNLVSGDVTEIRDNLYISVYMLEMFSYATYEYEGKYNLYKELYPDKILELNENNYLERYEEVTAEDEKGKWGSTDLTDTFNKSLTNKLIGSTNNPAYRCEIEYILFGNVDTDGDGDGEKDADSGNRANIKAAYTNIFTIRTLLNTVSVYENFWTMGGSNTGRVLNLTANAISGATGGIVPAPAIKIVVLLLLSVLETCSDMERLAAGFPVELYKDAEDWQYSFDFKGNSYSDEYTGITAIINQFKTFTTFKNTDKGLFYGDYIMLFVCLGMQDNTLSKQMTMRMGDLIQQNMRKISDNSNYCLEYAKTHFKLEAEMKVDPLLINMPLFGEYSDQWDSSKKIWGAYKVEAIRGY